MRRTDVRGRSARGLPAVIALVLAACGPAPAVLPAPSTAPAAVPRTSFTVLATGDVLIHQGGSLVRGAAEAGRANGRGYDFSGVFAPVAPLIEQADLAICHLETPVAPSGGPFRGYPSFSVQPQILDALAAVGYDTCSTASNHSLDTGFDGLVRTWTPWTPRGSATPGRSGLRRTAVHRRSLRSGACGLRIWPGPTA